MTCKGKSSRLFPDKYKTHKRNVSTMENWLKLSLVVRKVTARLWKVNKNLRVIMESERSLLRSGTEPDPSTLPHVLSFHDTPRYYPPIHAYSCDAVCTLHDCWQDVATILRLPPRMTHAELWVRKLLKYCIFHVQCTNLFTSHIQRHTLLILYTLCTLHSY
jgi:hypothetical protein